MIAGTSRCIWGNVKTASRTNTCARTERTSFRGDTPYKFSSKRSRRRLGPKATRRLPRNSFPLGGRSTSKVRAGSVGAAREATRSTAYEFIAYSLGHFDLDFVAHSCSRVPGSVGRELDHCCAVDQHRRDSPGANVVCDPDYLVFLIQIDDVDGKARGQKRLSSHVERVSAFRLFHGHDLSEFLRASKMPFRIRPALA